MNVRSPELVGGLAVSETSEQIARDVLAVGEIDAVPTLLQVLSETSGMGFAAVARVTENTWTVCAVLDHIGIGLKPGSQLDIKAALWIESQASGTPIVIDHASHDPNYRNHHSPKLYPIESCISVPIVLADGRYFGNLCAVDRAPVRVSEPRIVIFVRKSCAHTGVSYR